MIEACQLWVSFYIAFLTQCFTISCASVLAHERSNQFRAKISLGFAFIVTQKLPNLILYVTGLQMADQLLGLVAEQPFANCEIIVLGEEDFPLLLHFVPYLLLFYLYILL
jgi:hypothetical protein